MTTATTRVTMTGMTPEEMTEPGTQTGPWARALVEGMRSVRARILASVLMLTALGMELAGVAVYLVQNARIETRIQDAMAQEIAEFENLHATGIDPRTGQPFASLERLFLVALQRNVPERRGGRARRRPVRLRDAGRYHRFPYPLGCSADDSPDN